jgi:hypothetical protein
LKIGAANGTFGKILNGVRFTPSASWVEIDDIMALSEIDMP